MSRKISVPAEECPPWDLVVEIAVSIWRTGSYLALVGADPDDTTDRIRRAAAEAARMLGARALVGVSSPFAGDDPTVVTVRFADPDGRGVRRAQDGLGELLRSVRAEQHAR